MPLTRHHTYDGCHTTTSRVVAPRSEGELVVFLQHNRERNIVVRGAGLSLDRHSSSTDLTVSTQHLDHFAIDPEAGTVTAGPGATWGAIQAAAERHNLQPGAMPTAPDITLGGTLSTNALSRLSGVQGQEGAHVLSLRLVTVDGAILHCSPHRNADVFYGVIGGLGQLGIVTEVTHRLLPIPDGARMATHLHHSAGTNSLLDHLRSSDGVARYVALGLRGGRVEAVCARSHIVQDVPLDPIPVYASAGLARTLLEVAICLLPFVGRTFWRVATAILRWRPWSGVDRLRDFTFFMEPGLRARQLLGRRGIRPRILEQTWVLPGAHLPSFVDALAAACHENALAPALFDVVYLPPTGPVLLASAPDGGYAVNLAFTSVSDRVLPRVHALFADFTERCAAASGRVHLTKNVIAHPLTVAQMYGPALDAFFVLKRRLDPDNRLGSDFFARTFGPRQAPASDRLAG